MKKHIQYSHGKQYLLGKNKDNEYVYLTAPSWDCDWYWGFGYIKKTGSHTHWNSDIVGKQEDGSYCHHLNENKDIVESVLTDSESWKLSELMESFYILRKTAEFYHMGGSHITENPLKDKLKNKSEYNKINNKLLPLIFKEIDKILSPKGGKRFADDYDDSEED